MNPNVLFVGAGLMRARWLLVLLAALAVGGCAFTNPQNTPLLTALDEAIEPGPVWAKAALGPVFVPVGVACGALDLAVVHPVHSIALGAADTWADVWADPQGSVMEEIALFVPKVAVTPLVFAHRWAGHSLFNIPRGEESEER